MIWKDGQLPKADRVHTIKIRMGMGMAKTERSKKCKDAIGAPDTKVRRRQPTGWVAYKKAREKGRTGGRQESRLANHDA